MYQHNGKTTDNLINEEAEITNTPNKREHDVLVSVGEQITIAKIAMCLEKLGYPAVSYTGWQVPIITDSIFGNSRIIDIDTTRIENDLKDKKIVIVAGFQGIDKNLNITTLGRGGSDTTAVALAVSLKADRCDIFTDVDGIYSSDPRIINNVTKIKTISYDEMLEMASLGAKVLHNRCVEIGKKYNLPIYVKSTFEKNSTGTLVSNFNNLEELKISGVTKQDDIIKITLTEENNTTSKIYQIFKLLADEDINVDNIVQNCDENLNKSISFTITKNNLTIALNILNSCKNKLNISEIKYLEKLSKVSIVGVGIANSPQIKADLFNILYKNNINIYMISTSEIKISVIIDENIADMALQTIHKFFIEK